MAKEVKSVQLTGGAGFVFEDGVAGLFLAALASGAFPFGSDIGKATRLDWQTRGDGWLLDDLGVSIKRTDSGTLALSIKSDRQVTRRGFPASFVEAAREQWRSQGEDSPFRTDRDLLGLGVGELAQEVGEAWNNLLRQSLAGDPKRVGRRYTSDEGSDNIGRALFRSFLSADDADASESVRFIRHIRLLHFDFNEAASRSQGQAIQMCQRALASGNSEEAVALWHRLVSIAAERRALGGSLDREGLLKLLRPDFLLAESPDHSAFWAALDRRSSDYIDCVLPARNPHFVGRQGLIDAVEQFLATHRSGYLVLDGAMGVGKTALLTELIHRARGRGQDPVFHFMPVVGSAAEPERIASCLYSRLRRKYFTASQAERFGEGVEAAWSLKLQMLLERLSTNIFRKRPTPEVLYVDGADRAYADIHRPLVPGILPAQLPAGVVCIITSRSGTRWMHAPVTEFSMSSLADDRIDVHEYLSRHVPRVVSDLVEAIVGQGNQPVFFTVVHAAAKLMDPSTPVAEQEELLRDASPWRLPPRQLIEWEVASRLRPSARQRGLGEEDLWRTLGPLAVAFAPLSEQHLRDLGLWDPSSSEFVFLLAANFFERRLDVRSPALQYHFAHPGYAEEVCRHLTSAEIRGLHARLADGCLRAMQDVNNTAHSYALRYLPLHLATAERWSELIKHLNDAKLSLFRRWLEEGGVDEGLYCIGGSVEYLRTTRGRRRRIAALLTQSARLHGLRGDYRAAKRQLLKAVRLTSPLRGRRVRAVALHELGSLHLYRGQLDDAERVFRAAYRLCLCAPPRLVLGSNSPLSIQRTDTDETAANLLGLAAVNHARYSFEKAISYSKRALNVAARSADHQHVVSARRLLAVLNNQLGRFDDARMHLQEAFDLASKTPLPIERVRLLMARGWLEYNCAMLGKKPLTPALESFQEAAIRAQRLSYRYGQFETLLSLGWCALIESRTSDAQEMFRSGDTTESWSNHFGLEAGFLVGAAATVQQEAAKMQLPDFKDAIRSYKRAQTFAAEHGAVDWRVDALIGLGACWFHTQQCEKAESLWNDARNLASSCSPIKQRLCEISIERCRCDSLATPL